MPPFFNLHFLTANSSSASSTIARIFATTSSGSGSGWWVSSICRAFSVALAERGILGGYDLSADFPELGDALLVCATETKLDQDIEAYARALGEVMRQAQVA